MKKIILVIFLVFLVGCSTEVESFETTLATKLEAVAMANTLSPDNRKTFYSYYIEPSIGRRKTDETYNIFVKDGIEFAMNLNISNILNDSYYKKTTTLSSTIQSEALWFSNSGKYVDYKGEENDYFYSVYQDSNFYYITFMTKYVTFFASGNQSEILAIAPEMLKIAKTVEINQDEIVSAYFSQEVIEYEREKIQLYEVMIPENGRIEEMMADRVIPTNEVDGTGEWEYSNDNYESETEKEEKENDDEEEKEDNAEEVDAHDDLG